MPRDAYQRGVDKASLRPWRVREAAALVQRLAPVASRHGYVLGLYGSTLGGRGRDLDVVAFPWGEFRTGRCLASGLAKAIGGRVVERLATPFARAAGILLPDGRFVDLLILGSGRAA